MNNDKIIDVLVMAAGLGARLGGDIPKQFLPLAGAPMLGRTLAVFASHPVVRHIQVVIGAGQESFYQYTFSCHPRGLSRKAAKEPGDPQLRNPIDSELEIKEYETVDPRALLRSPEDDKLLDVVTGGKRRQDSVLAGLVAMEANAPDYVLIVDAARPFTTHKMIDDVVAALRPDTAVLTAIPVADTIKFAAAEHTKTIERKDHWLAQTPQAFPFAKILALHRDMQTQDFTDDVALFEAQGLPVKIVRGSARNFKITTQEDFQMAEALLAAQQETRIGHGFDVHRFKDGKHVWLGGVKIPHAHGIEAHSDGDVILHALTDALLGAIGAGDIGQHFPPSDAKWKNASSDLFVRHAVGLLHARGGAVVNADITVLCEAPKVGPHRDVMRAKIAELLGVDAARVNVKATTTEKLGALGRAEGLAAEAVVCIKL